MHSEQSLAAMAPSLPLIATFLLNFLLCFCSSTVHGKGGQSHIIARFDKLIPGTVCSMPKGLSENSLKISHQHGPCSPLTRKKKPTQIEILHADQMRVASLQRSLSKASQAVSGQNSYTTLPTRRGDAFGTHNYIVTVGIGTPKRDQTVIMDTGSDICWIQCEPCLGSCYKQQQPLFNPSTSSSYHNISCSSPECIKYGIKFNGSCYNQGTCVYGVRYGDNSITSGFLSRETLTLTPSDVFPNFIFGCGQQNYGLFGEVAGLFGLGRDGTSLVSQTSSKFGSFFSYCLPHSPSSTGQLKFGGTISSNSKSYTPMLTDSRNPSFYFLSLTGISVAGRKLMIPPSVFSTPGTIIDSGTVITRLPPMAYQSLRSAFRSGMSDYPMTAPYELFDTCYDFSGRENGTVPSVALHFDGGVDLDLDITGILVVVDNISTVCLAFAGNEYAESLGIIGNVQQATVELTYDLGMKRIGFASGVCN